MPHFRLALSELNKKLIPPGTEHPSFKAWLTTGGAVYFHTDHLSGYMHPDQYRKDFGEEAYRELLNHPLMTERSDA